MWKKLLIGAGVGLIGAYPVYVVTRYLAISVLATPSSVLQYGPSTILANVSAIGYLAAVLWVLFLVFRAHRSSSSKEATGSCLKSLGIVFLCVMIVSLLAERSSMTIAAVGAALGVACMYFGRKLLMDTQKRE